MKYILYSIYIHIISWYLRNFLSLSNLPSIITSLLLSFQLHLLSFHLLIDHCKICKKYVRKNPNLSLLAKRILKIWTRQKFVFLSQFAIHFRSKSSRAKLYTHLPFCREWNSNCLYGNHGWILRESRGNRWAFSIYLKACDFVKKLNRKIHEEISQVKMFNLNLQKKVILHELYK